MSTRAVQGNLKYHHEELCYNAKDNNFIEKRVIASEGLEILGTTESALIFSRVAVVQNCRGIDHKGVTQSW